MENKLSVKHGREIFTKENEGKDLCCFSMRKHRKIKLSVGWGDVGNV